MSFVSILATLFALLLGSDEPASPAIRTDVATQLEWLAPESCPDREQVRETLRQLLDATISAPSIEIRAEVRHDTGNTLRLRIDVTGGLEEGPRIFFSPDCEELAATAALVAAIAIDPFGVSGAAANPDPQPEPDDPDEPKASDEPAPPSPPPTSESKVADASQAPAVWPVWALHLSAGPVWSEQARPTTTLRLMAARQWKILGLRFGAEGWLPQRFGDQQTPGGDAIGIAVSRLLTRVEGCALPGRIKLSVPLCLGVNGGAVLGRGYGVRAAQSRASLSMAVVGNAGVLWRPGAKTQAGPIGLFLSVEAMAQLARARFRIEDRPPAYTGSGWSAAVLAGVEIRLRSSQ